MGGFRHARSKSDDPSFCLPVNTTNVENADVRSSPLKKVPPPPPPRRASQHPSVAPPIPKKGQHNTQATASSTSSSSGSPLVSSSNLLNIPESSGECNVRNDQSPFDSVVELGVSTDSEGGEGACDRFRQNPFKPKGICSNCLEIHDI